MIPYLGWPIIIYVLNNLTMSQMFKMNKKYSLNDLMFQLLWGSNYMMQLWFQWILIFTTMLFFMMMFMFSKYHLFTLQLLGIAAYMSQYSLYNLWLYKSLNKECLGSFAELLPYASTGFTLCTFKIFNVLNKKKMKTMIFSLMIFNFVENYPIFMMPEGVIYQWIQLNVSAMSLIFLFSVFPSEYMTNKLVMNILKQITNYTPGMFYLHWNMYLYFSTFIKPIYKSTFLGCIYLYLMCYLMCFFSMKMVGNTPLKNLFS